MFDLAKVIGAEKKPEASNEASNPFFIKFQIPEPSPVSKPSFSDSGKIVSDGDDYMSSARKYVLSNETSGKTYSKPYKDSNGNWTIGVGHLIKPEEMQRFMGKVLTKEEIDDLFTEDLHKRTNEAKRVLGKSFDKMSNNLKVAVIDGFYRGDLSGSPDTLMLIKEGKWTEASKEFLNNNEYRKSLAKIASGEKHGVAARMERISEALLQEGIVK